MHSSHAALRNAGLLLLQRGGLLIAGLIFAAVVPRLMGPGLYGRYALLSALGVLFASASTLGFTEAIGRHGPRLQAEPDPGSLRRLFGTAMTLRLVSGLAVALAYLLLTMLWLGDLDRVALGAAALAVLARATWQGLFGLFLGLNRADRWGAGELTTRWAVAALVPAGVVLGGLRGACIGLGLGEMITVGLGLWWTRAHFSLRRPDWRYLSPYLRVGLPFFASNLLSIAFHGSGEVLVRVITADYAEVSYYGVANGTFLTAAAAVHTLSLAFVAAFVMLREAEGGTSVDAAARRLVTFLSAGSMAVVFSVLFLAGDLVPRVVGQAYGAVAANLVPMTLTLLLLSLSSTAGVVLLVHDRGPIVLIGSGIRLAAFWTLGPMLIAWGASLGACLAVLVASALQAAFVGWRIRGQIPRALRAWGAAVALGAPFLALLWWRGPWWMNLGLWLLACAGYLGALVLTRVITPGEIAATWMALAAREASRDGPGRA
jgi:O-antigen/teichoic acid export membrane protein